MTTDTLAVRLKELDDDNSDLISRTASKPSAFDLRFTIRSLDNILQETLNIAPEDIRDFFSHYDNRQNSTVIAHDGTRCPF